MKTLTFINTSLLVSVLTACIFSFTGCGDDEVSGKDKNMKLITSGTWNIQTVTVDAVDNTSQYTGMTLTFDQDTYTSVNGSPIWSSTDTWALKNKSGTVFTRGDEIDVTIVSITKTQLVLSLEWDDTTIGSGKQNSVPGAYQFSFTK